MNKLKCPLCIQNLFIPKMCPHCSQVFCQICIINYLAQKHFCPTCDNYIIDLVDCSRLIQELQQVVIARKNTQLTTNTCKQHNLQLTYYCKDCQKWICSDCGVITQAHRSHKILTKIQVFISHKQQFHKQLLNIIQQISKQNKKKQLCQHNRLIFSKQYQKIKKLVQEYFSQVLKKINQQYEEKLAQFQFYLQLYSKNLQKLEKQQYSLIKIIQNQNLFLNNHQNLQQQNKHLINNFNINLFPSNSHPQPSKQLPEQTHFLANLPKITTMYSNILLSNSIFPSFTYFNYQLNYQNLKQDLFHYSHFFQTSGQDWRLKIYPKGNSAVTGKYLSVFLQLANVMQLAIQSYNLREQQHRYIYKIQLLNYNQTGENITHQYCSDFSGGQSWGYSTFLNLSKLNNYLHKGKLHFTIGIRNQSYEGLCNDLKKYINKLQNQNKILQKLVCDNVSLYSSSKISNEKSLSDINSNSQIKMDSSEEIQVSIENS